jgi:hypothetical protein
MAGQFRARFLKHGSRVGTGDPAPEAEGRTMTKRNKHRAADGGVQVPRQVIRSAPPEQFLTADALSVSGIMA